MKLYELLKQYSNKNILKALHKNYDDVSDDAYLSALDELRTVKPATKKQNLKIRVEFQKDNFLDEDNDKEYLACDGIGPNEKGEIIRWGLEFDRWEDWLAKEIDEESFKKLDDLTILAGIMWELTYNGYCQEEVKERADDLNGRITEIKEHPERLKNWDEVKKELDEDENNERK